MEEILSKSLENQKIKKIIKITQFSRNTKKNNLESELKQRHKNNITKTKITKKNNFSFLLKKLKFDLRIKNKTRGKIKAIRVKLESMENIHPRKKVSLKKRKRDKNGKKEYIIIGILSKKKKIPKESRITRRVNQK